MTKSKIAFVLLAVLALGACAADEKPLPGTSGNAAPSASSSSSESASASSAAPGEPVALNVVAAKPAANTYAFDTAGVQSIPAGPVAITFSNTDEMAHEVRVVSIRDGNFSAYRAAIVSQTDGSNGASLADDVATSGPVDPGKSTTFDAELSPGTYALVCFLDAGDGKVFAQLGMIRELTVTPA